MCFNNKYKYRTLHLGFYYITKKKSSIKLKKKKKQYLKDCMAQFFNLSYKKIVQDNNTTK